jgi:phage/plasmid primase-like uncharacterized protein
MQRDLGAAEVARLLAGRIEALVADLLPAGRRIGHEWRVGSLAGEAGKSLGVHMGGTKTGVWADFASGAAGDPLDLVRAVLGLDMVAALDWSRRWLGLDRGEAPPARSARQPKDDDAARRQARALEIWRSARESIVDTLAETYLRSRGLVPDRLASLSGAGRWPATLRYSERAALDPERECRALVVAVHEPGGLVRAVQRIILGPDGRPIRDTRGKKIKLSLGPIGGNAAKFDYGPDPHGRWGIAEGCETALCAYHITGIPTWAAISAGNMPRVAPPRWARRATIFADRDEAGLAAAADTLRALRRPPQIEAVEVVAAARNGQDMADLLATPEVADGAAR